MIVLGIESSCDETAAAVLADGRRILSSVVASQDAIHAPYGGVVPELASRRHLEVIVPVVEKALADANVRLPDLDGIAVTQGPGLVGSLLVGCSVAKSLAYVHRLRLVAVNHLQGHIYASFLTDDPPEHPFLALVVSGGHTALYHARAPLTYALVGQTRDDAAGEAFDKVAKLLGLGFPGGPVIERTAVAGDPKAITFPLAQMSDGGADFSFSGVKTSVSLYVKQRAPLAAAEVADVAASFQATVVKMLVRKTVKAALHHGIKRVVLTGGVAANGRLREALEAAAIEHSARRAEGRYIKEVFSPDASVVRRLGETLATGESRSEAESFIERADGRRVPVSVITAPLCGRDGQVEAAVVVLRDLSRIHQLEAEVRRGETLAAAGRMAVGLAHEVRNPLGAIRGAVQLLGREIGPDSRLREYTDVLLTEVDRVNRIIEMLLDLARPIQLRAVPLNLHQLLERVTLLNEEGARERGVTMIRRYDPSLPPILGDEDRLLQVFHNLVRNALDSMERGGRLTLTTRVSLNPLFGKMDLGTGQRSMVEAQVADEGAGIPAGVRARIFDPFFPTKDKGRGLGLSICHRILEEHRGAIQVESAEGRGTSVTCFLPLAK